MFLKSTTVDSLDATLDAIDGDLRRTQSHNRAQSLVCVMDCPVVPSAESLPYNPQRRNGSCDMCIWNFRQWREENGVEDVVVDQHRQDQCGSDKGEI